MLLSVHPKLPAEYTPSRLWGGKLHVDADKPHDMLRRGGKQLFFSFTISSSLRCVVMKKEWKKE
jgi:hypothetical protein